MFEMIFVALFLVTFNIQRLHRERTMNTNTMMIVMMTTTIKQKKQHTILKLEIFESFGYVA